MKRLRLSPLPTWMAMAAVLLNAMIIAALGVILLLVIGRLGYGVHGPAHWLPVHRDAHRRHALLQRVGRGHEHAGAQRRRGRAHGEPDLLHPGRAVGALVPHPARARAWPRSPTIFPIRHLIDALVASFTGQPGHAPLALARPRASWRSGGWPAPSWACGAGPGRRNGAEPDQRAQPDRDGVSPSAGQSAVDDQHLAGDERVGRVGQEEHGAGHVVGFAEPPSGVRRAIWLS